MCFSCITLIAGLIVISLAMNYINYMHYDRDIATQWELGVNIPALAVQFVGLVGARRENQSAIWWYSLLMGLFAGLSIGTGLLSDFIANWLLTGLYSMCSCLALTFAYELRRLRLNAAIAQLWQTTGASGGAGISVSGGQPPATQFGGGGSNHGGVIQMISPASMIQPSTVYQPTGATGGPAVGGGDGGGSGQVYPLNPGASGNGYWQYVEHPPSYQQSVTTTTDRQQYKLHPQPQQQY
ncbi:uncharacterized protein LOC128956854 [Oppia nitens]|uniref:uncharacterized protein LOC128956854 n=1 Tax=Oppia nitens TaxID=1686743 RepID=UPI0023DC38B2|nr:uncharacterized protein LOC128956854 [Oppia nitens]